MVAATASAQSFNVDFGGQGTGLAAPAATFGAAAGQAGVWNDITTTGSAASLQNLGGTNSATSLTATAQLANGYYQSGVPVI